jgi:hypothetical protein
MYGKGGSSAMLVAAGVPVVGLHAGWIMLGLVMLCAVGGALRRLAPSEEA